MTTRKLFFLVNYIYDRRTRDRSNTPVVYTSVFMNNIVCVVGAVSDHLQKCDDSVQSANGKWLILHVILSPSVCHCRIHALAARKRIISSNRDAFKRRNFITHTRKVKWNCIVYETFRDLQWPKRSNCDGVSKFNIILLYMVLRNKTPQH